jgi:hypothetical protein
MFASKFALIAMSLAIPAAAGATQLLDGGFELRGAAVPVTDYCYAAGVSAGRPACLAGPWSGGGVIRDGSAAWGGRSSPDGIYYGFLQGRNAIEQTFVATGNQIGTLNWIDNNRPNLGPTAIYDVTIFDGQSTTNIGNFTAAISPNWASRASSNFTLVAGRSYTLSFRGATAGDRTAFIDGISLSTTAVPDASTWMMLIAGFGLVGAAARRSRGSVAA